jgi:hypothetical protein
MQKYTRNGRGTNKQDVADSEGQSVFKKRKEALMEKHQLARAALWDHLGPTKPFPSGCWLPASLKEWQQ